MGSTVSRAFNNNELVDNMMKSGYIKTKQVERVFRVVDRGDYVLPSHTDNIYEDLAWKIGNIHLSAPCVYSEAMEALSLESGQSFLNLGSGTGYFSTMAGLILNQHGTNHGIEIHEDCVEHAYKCLEEFKEKSLALDEFDFCEPVFVQGNCLSIAPSKQYDRVYCGATCSTRHEAFIKQFVRVGGVLVMPFKDHLLRIQRISDQCWVPVPLLPVSFANLIEPTSSEQTLCHLPECCPLSLQELCRGRIRHRLRQNVWHEHRELETRKTITIGFSTTIKPTMQTRDLGESESDQDSDEVTLSVRPLCLCSNNWQDSSNYINDQLNGHSVNVDSSGSESNDDSNNLESFTNPIGHNVVQNSSEFMEEESEDQNRRSNSTSNTQNVATLTSDTRSRISESDSDSNQEDDNLSHRKKVFRCVPERTDDTHTEEDVNSSNKDGSSNSETDPPEIRIVDGAHSCRWAMNEHFFCPDSNENVTTAHYVDNDAFTKYMKEKIQQLPLASPLKLYINYDRKL